MGIEARDALGRPGPLGGAVALHVERDLLRAPVARVVPDGLGLPHVRPGASGRFALLVGNRHVAEDAASVVVRLVDAARRYVPRRFELPLVDPEVLAAADDAHLDDPLTPVPRRTFRPVLFPAAAYGLAAGTTAVRGRVVQPAPAGQSSPATRWVRVEARTSAQVEVHQPDGTVTLERPLLGRAHGDDRGEFVLVLGSLPFELWGTTSGTIAVRLTVTADAAPMVDSPVDEDDPLGDLPIESLLTADALAVAAGEVVPDGYTASVTETISCRRGAVNRPAVPYVLP